MSVKVAKKFTLIPGKSAFGAKLAIYISVTSPTIPPITLLISNIYYILDQENHNIRPLATRSWKFDCYTGCR